MRPSSVFVFAVLVGCGGGSGKKPPDNPTTPDPVTTTEPQPTSSPTPTATPPGPAKAKSLYDRLGGQGAITAVVEEFVTRTTTDPAIKHRFFNTDATQLKKLLVEFVCEATGGPCKYTGRDMESSHAGMDLVDDEFNALVNDLVGALDKFKVPEKEKGELLGALGPLKPMMVKPEKLKPLDAKKLEAVTKLAAKIKDAEAQELLNFAVTAGKRGQRSYAEQLFTRAEMKVGAKAVAAVAATFRAGAPARVTTALKKLPADSKPQPSVVGSSEADEPDAKPAKGALTGTLTLDGKAPSGKGVVMLWPKAGKAKARTPKQRIIEQRDKMFAPQVMAVPVGSTVSFPNFDPIYHNVFSLSKVKAFDLGMYKNGETREVKVDKPGIVRLGCNLHAAMSAYLIVVDAPHYVIPDASGKFEFKSLAPGKYKVQAWNERSGDPMTTEIEVKEGANETKLDLKSGGAPTVSPDKFGTARDK